MLPIYNWFNLSANTASDVVVTVDVRLADRSCNMVGVRPPNNSMVSEPIVKVTPVVITVPSTLKVCVLPAASDIGKTSCVIKSVTIPEKLPSDMLKVGLLLGNDSVILGGEPSSVA